MAKNTNITEQGGDRAPATAKFSAGPDDSAERPPESAEDFGHVLRRLIAGRGSQSEDDGRR